MPGDQLLELVFVFFVLSLLAERISEWLKYQEWFKRLFQIKNTTLKLPSEQEEQKRYYRILKINIFIAILVALLLRADLFYLLKHKGPIQLGWPKDLAEFYPSSDFAVVFQIVLGCICTGFFLSFGSKLWHDLLDIVLAFKEAKKQLSQGFPVTNAASFDSLKPTEKEAAMKGAIETFGPKWKHSISNYAGVGIGKKRLDKQGKQTNETVLEFYVKNKSKDAAHVPNPVPEFINYGGILIPTDVKQKTSDIKAHWSNPGGNHIPPRPGESISRENDRATGTISLKVIRAEDDGTEKMYLLSCYHVLFSAELDKGLLEIKPGLVLKRSENLISPGKGTNKKGRPLAKARYGCINDYIDAGVALLNNQQGLSDSVDQLGEPAGIRPVTAEDVNVLEVSFCGAKSGKVTGIKIKACNQTRPYNISPVHPGRFLHDLIEIEKCSFEGDSGAPVMDDDENIIGIIIGADDDSTYVVPIQSIVNSLSVYPKLKQN